MSRRKEGDQEEIVQLKARKKCLEIELEAVVRTNARVDSVLTENPDHVPLCTAPR